MSLINNGATAPEQNETPLGARNFGYESEQPVSAGQDIGSIFSGGPSSALARQFQRDDERRAETYDVANPWAGPQEPQMSPEEANDKYAPKGPDGKKVNIFDQPVTDGTAKLIGKQKSDEMDRNAIMDRFSDQHNPITNFGAGMVGFMLDPLNAASAFVPGVGEASVLNGMGRVGLATSGLAARSAARVISGATAGAASQAPLAALTYGLDQQQASDFHLRDAFKSVLYAAAGNAIFHAGFFGGAHELGILKPDAAMRYLPQSTDPRANEILKAPATTQHAAMQSAIGQMVEGRQVNVDPLFPKPEDSVSPASVADKESQTYRDGYAPGLTTGELQEATKEILPEDENVQKAQTKAAEEPGTEGPVLDQYKEKINAEAQRLGVPTDDARLTRAAQTMAEDHNPEAPQGPPLTEFDKARGNILNGGEIPAETTTAVPTKSGDIPRSTANLSTPDRDIESRFAQQVGDNFKKMAYEYSKVKDSRGGHVLNTDAARELSGDYLADRTKSAAVHEPASWFIKKLYEEKLTEKPKGDQLPLVQFTSGGTGAGKTTAIDSVGALRKSSEHAQIIYDTNMNKLGSSVDKIEKALAAGKDVHITYVYREPVDALVNGALPRAMHQEAKFGSGRTVPLKEHLATHTGSLETIKQLAEKYKGDERVNISVLDNSFGKGNAKLLSLDDLVKISHNNDIGTNLRSALYEEKQKGTISDQVYRGFAESNTGDAGENSGVPSDHRSVDGGQPQQERDGGAAPGENVANGREPIKLHPDDAAINELEARLDLTKMTKEETDALKEAHEVSVAANDHYQAKLQEYAACLVANGV